MHQSVVKFTIVRAWGESALGIARILGRSLEGTNLDSAVVVSADSAHMFPSEVDLDVGALHLLVEVSEVVLDMLVLQRDMVVLGS